jgi:Fe-S oxidoreductase
MAGSFGYTADHYSVSMAIGERVLFPAVRNASAAMVAAAGTSCRHQIKDGTGATALHPIELIANLLSEPRA